MSDTKDILLFRQVLEEMGIPFQEGQGGITINGIPAVQYLDEHDIFAVPEEVQINFRGDDVTISDFIGGILYYQRDGLGERELSTIKELCKQSNIKVPENIVKTYLELYDPNGYFYLDFYENRILPTKNYYNMRSSNYFDRLSKDEKNLVYKVVSRI